MRKILIGIALGVAAALVAAAAALAPFVETVERKTYDWRIQATADPASARRDIVLVAIDQASIRSLEPLVGRWPWPRMVHGSLVDFLARGPAKVVVYDVIFAERDRRSLTVGDRTWTGEESDRALVEATARAGNVVNVVDVVGEAGGLPQAGFPVPQPFHLDDRIETRPVAIPPFEELAKASRALGHNFVVADPDGPLRRAVPFVRSAGQFIPSLPVAAALIAGGISPASVKTDSSSLRLGGRAVPLIDAELPSFDGGRHPSRRMLIRYPGGLLDPATKRPTYADYSFYDLFYSEMQIEEGVKPMVDPARFKDAIVVVGTTAPGLHDLDHRAVRAGEDGGHAGPRERHRQPAVRPIPGARARVGRDRAVVDVRHPGRRRHPAPRRLAGPGDRGPRHRPCCGRRGGRVRPRDVAPDGRTGAGAGGGRLRGRVLPVPRRRAGEAAGEEALLALRFQGCLRAADGRPVAARSLGGQRREMTVLFSDIRGFTTFSEQGQPEEIVQQLNEYFSRMVHVLFEHRGTLDKFVGDAVMALFGAPVADPDHAEHAVQAALAMLTELEHLNRVWASQGRPTLAIGVGVNTGEMVAGNIGSDTIMSYTVIGDAVNLGSRLESLNKQYGTSVIVSETTRARLKGRYDIRPLGEVLVKGKTVPVTIFEVARPPAASTRSPAAGRQPQV